MPRIVVSHPDITLPNGFMIGVDAGFPVPSGAEGMPRMVLVCICSR